MSQERYRLAVLGSGRVGKTCLIRRFLNDTFSERYKETVEDIYSRDFNIKGASMPLDIYDTNFTYPDMTKLCVSNANAFLLVFAVDHVASFKDVTDIYRDVCHRRPNHASIPIVIAGNKADVEDKKIYPETVNVWMHGLKDSQGVQYLETSAKTKDNVVEIFKSLLQQSGFPYALSGTPLGGLGASSLLTPVLPRRNMSCRAKSPARHRDGSGDRSTRGIRRARSPQAEKPPETAVGRFTRHGSLMRRTQRMSLRIRHADPEVEDHSECKIS